jgi:hypothetical protein
MIRTSGGRRGSRELTGTERIREAIARDRGHYAPNRPVTLCGHPDGSERRADADWARIHVPAPGFWHRLAERLVSPVARLMGF